MSPEILDTEFKVGTLNLKTFESKELSRKRFFSRIRKVFRRQTFELARDRTNVRSGVM